MESSNDQLQSLQTINLSSELFANTSQTPPYRCKSHKVNPELHNLESNLFRESFYQMESESGIKISAYVREIGSYDEPYTEILTEEEWLKLPTKSPRIDEIKKEISKGEDAEFFTGIRHYRNYSQWNLAEMMQEIPVPELKAKIPDNL